jgi:hypothetical protein
MISKTKLLASALILALTAGAGPGCSSERETVDRWATTENTNVKIDWDKVNQAYRDASGPEDLEKRINDIYEGDEVISIAVTDQDDKTQVVTGFFDKNTSGSVDEGEKIFTIKREPTGEGAQYQTTGYGPYAGYHSPFFSIASGMLMGAMLSSMFMPRYVPVAYTTSAARADTMRSQRAAQRATNPGRASKSGRNYGTGGTRSSGTRSGGGRFGLRRRATKPVVLTA